MSLTRRGITLKKYNSDRIAVACSYDPQRIQQLKTIPCHRWHPKEKQWSFPNSDDTLEKILKIFEGEEIHFDSALHAELSNTVIARSFRPKQSQKDYPNNPPSPPL